MLTPRGWRLLLGSCKANAPLCFVLEPAWLCHTLQITSIGRAALLPLSQLAGKTSPFPLCPFVTVLPCPDAHPAVPGCPCPAPSPQLLHKLTDKGKIAAAAVTCTRKRPEGWLSKHFPPAQTSSSAILTLLLCCHVSVLEAVLGKGIPSPALQHPEESRSSAGRWGLTGLLPSLSLESGL